MELFEDTIRSLRVLLDRFPHKRAWTENPLPSWSQGGQRGIVMKEDLGLELGSPDKESVACLIWTEDLTKIADGRLTLVGPDFPESIDKSLPFGKVVLVGVEGFTEENAYPRQRAMDLIRFDLDLKGFMIRAVSQYMKEWCRISRKALMEGFSSLILASSLMGLIRKEPYVRSVEVVFITSSTSDVLQLKELVDPACKIIAAMNKMASDMDLDCNDCEYQDVCADSTELKRMHNRLKENTARGAHG